MMLNEEQKQKIDELIKLRLDACKKIADETRRNINETKAILIDQGVKFLEGQTSQNACANLRNDVSAYIDCAFIDVWLILFLGCGALGTTPDTTTDEKIKHLNSIYSDIAFSLKTI